MHDDVGTQAQGIAQKGRRHRVVNHQRHTMRVGDLGHGGNVEHDQTRIAQTLGKDGARVGSHGRSKSLGLRGIDKAGFNTKARQVYRQHRDTAAIERTGRDHMIALLQDGHQRHRLRSHAAGRRQCGTATLQRRHTLFEGRHRRVGQARIDVAKGLQVEEARCVLGAVKNETGGLVDRQGARAGGGIGRLPGVNGQGFGLKLVFGHSRL